jgi:hypothetical protein
MRYLIALLLFIAAAPGQLPYEQFPTRKPGEKPPARLPNGTLQSEAIIKAEHEKSLQDVEEMKKLILDFTEEFEKSDRHTVSVQMVKKLEEIEKRAKRIRNRLTRQ